MSNRQTELRALYERDYHRFHRLALGITHDPASAADAVQEGFARALARLSDLERERALAGWVWRIVLNAAHDLRRVSHQDAAHRADACDALPVAELLDAEHVLGDRDEGLRQALNRLPPRRRLAIFLRFYADLSYAEIAVAMGTSEGTVAASIGQAKHQLHQALTEDEVVR